MMRKNQAPIAANGLLGMMLTACTSAGVEPGSSPAGSSPAEAVVATWKGGAVDREKLESWRRFQRRDRRQSDAPTDVRSEIESLLLVETLAAAAGERGAEDEPALRFALESAEQRELLRALRRHLGERVEINEEEVQAQIRAQPELASRPRKVRLRNLYKRFPPGAREEEEKAALRARMEELLAELREGADFAELARRESDSQTRFHGELIGNVKAGEMMPAIDEIAMALAPGELSPVLDTGDGLVVLHCDDILEEVKRTPEEVRQMVVNHFRRQYEREGWESFQAELLGAASPRFDLALARDPAAGPEKVVARFEGGQITRGELSLLLASQPGRPSSGRPDPAEVDDQRLRSVLDSKVLKTLGAHRARQLGFAGDPELVERIAWQRSQLLAGDEIGRRIQEEFEPLTE